MINIPAKNLTYNKETATYFGSEKNIKFATKYEVEDEDTLRIFDFSHATGPEFDPKTKWVYKFGHKQLIIANDAEITKINAENYLAAKLGR